MKLLTKISFLITERNINAFKNNFFSQYFNLYAFYLFWEKLSRLNLDVCGTFFMCHPTQEGVELWAKFLASFFYEILI